jgi:hypothetical protein
MRLEQNEKLLNLSSTINEDDDITIINNTFFNLFCDGIYQQDTEQTNKLLHFENILRIQGFNISCQGDKSQLSTHISKAMNTDYNEQHQEHFYTFVSDMYNEVNVWDIPQYKKYLDKMEYLNIEEHELYEYEFLLNNEYNYNSYFSFMKMFWKSECLNNKLTESNNMNVKQLDEVANKILLLRKFEKANNNSIIINNSLNNDENLRSTSKIENQLTSDLSLPIRKIFKPMSLAEVVRSANRFKRDR